MNSRLSDRMKYVGLRKVKWIAFGLAFIGIIQTPFVLRRPLLQSPATD
jgi:hypothetical protein